MAVIVKSSGGDFKSLDPGTYISRCISLWEIGTHESDYQGEIKTRRQVILQWEVPEELADDGKPMTISGFYTLSLHEKSNLYKTLVAWRGRNFTDEELAGFDMETIVGAPCLLTVVHNDNGRARVGAVAKLGKGMACADAVHPLSKFSMDTSSEEDFINLPDWVQEQVKKSVERRQPDQYKAAETGDGPAGDAPGDDDDVPF